MSSISRTRVVIVVVPITRMKIKINTENRSTASPETQWLLAKENQEHRKRRIASWPSSIILAALFCRFPMRVDRNHCHSHVRLVFTENQCKVALNIIDLGTKNKKFLSKPFNV